MAQIPTRDPRQSDPLSSFVRTVGTVVSVLLLIGSSAAAGLLGIMFLVANETTLVHIAGILLALFGVSLSVAVMILSGVHR